MNRRQRTWLVRINVAVGVAFGLSCIVASLLVTTGWLGLTSQISLLRLLNSWQQALYFTAFLVYMGGIILYALVQRRRDVPDNSVHE